MKFQTATLMATAMLLVACSPSADKELTMACAIVAGDEEPKEELASRNISADDYCSCMAQTIAAMGDAEKAKTASALTMVADKMTEGEGASAQAIYAGLRTAARADDATPEAIAAYEGMDELGEQMEDVMDGMSSSGGTCPAAKG